MISYTTYVDCGRIQNCFNMNRIVFFDHLNAGATVFGYLVDISAFHESNADIGVAKAVGGAPVAFAVKLQTFFRKDRVEQLPVALGEYEIRRGRIIPLY